MAVARNNRHNAAFVVGSVLGAVAGAAVALWKTPYTGEELRTKLTGASAQDGTEVQTYGAPTSTGTTAGEERSIKDKVLSGVEKTLAPIVGVELGKTANDSGTTTMDSGRMKVSPDYGSTASTGATAGTGTEKLGLSVDKVDAEKWAQAYGTAGSSTASTPSEPVKTAKPEAESAEYGSTLLRHPHAWKDGSETATTGETDDTKLGLSVDKVNADEWAAAYGTSAESTATTPSTPAATPTTTDTTVGDAESARLRPRRSWGTGADETASGSESDKLGLSRDKVNADEWASAYGTQASSGSTQETRVSGSTSSEGGYASKAAESEAQTGLGAKPAYPGRDQVGHEPVDRTAPDSNVADVDQRADDIRTDSGLTIEDAASVESLTTPNLDRIPDSMRAPDERNYHPFPKLGGKDS